jgi:hypothetical protein
MKKSDQKKILIIGNKCHGKTTYANYLSEALGDAENHTTSSYLVYRLGLIKGMTSEEILAQKEDFRQELIDLGNAMCEADPGCLVSLSLWAATSKWVIVDGVRRISEFEKVKDWFDHVIWIDRPAEPIGLDNLELTRDMASEFILNDGDLAKLKKTAQLKSKELL